MNRTAICIPKCSHLHGYTPSDLHSTRSALLIGSILSFTLTAVCLVSSCMARKMMSNGKKRPVETTLFYSAFCFAFSAAVYILSVFQRDKVTKERVITIPTFHLRLHASPIKFTSCSLFLESHTFPAH